jgi:hypothetical protein
MEHPTLFGGGTLEIVQGTGLVVAVLQIDLAGSHPVTEHLCQKAHRHFHRLDPFGFRVIVRPVLEVVAVAPLVVHPRQRIAVCLTFGFVGAAFAVLIIADTLPELCGAVLGKIVAQSLPEDPRFAAVPDNGVPVPGDGGKMSPERMPAHNKNLLCVEYLFQYTAFGRKSQGLCGKKNSRLSQPYGCQLL